MFSELFKPIPEDIDEVLGLATRKLNDKLCYMYTVIITAVACGLPASYKSVKLTNDCCLNYNENEKDDVKAFTYIPLSHNIELNFEYKSNDMWVHDFTSFYYIALRHLEKEKKERLDRVQKLYSVLKESVKDVE